MAVIRPINQTFRYILKEDRKLKEEKQTVFIYELPSLESQYYNQTEEILMGQDPNNEERNIIRSIKSGSAIKKDVAIILSSLTEILNLKDNGGKVITWPSDDEEKKKKILSAFPKEWLSELSDEFSKKTVLKEKEIKN